MSYAERLRINIWGFFLFALNTVPIVKRLIVVSNERRFQNGSDEKHTTGTYDR